MSNTMYRLLSKLLIIQMIIASLVLGYPVPTARPDAEPASTNSNAMESMTASMNQIVGGSNAKDVVPRSPNKCTVGCGVGIGIGCLAAIILGALAYITLRRHKRKLHTLWLHNRWLSRQKDLPDKPMPAPPVPIKN